MDLTNLKYFSAVADTGSFSRAAISLNMAQPSISRAVKLLEEEFGQLLLERNGRGVRLTEAGLTLRSHAQSILEATERAKSDMAERLQNPRGKLIVGIPHRVAQVITADFVQRFHERFPEVMISVVEGLSLRLRELLISGRADIAILFDPQPSPQIQTDLLLREPLVLVSRNPLPPKIQLVDLARYCLVLPTAPNALRSLLEKYTVPRGVSLKLVAEVDSVHTVLSIVVRGLADSVLPASAPRQWGMDRCLHVAKIYAPVIRNSLFLVTPRTKTNTRLTSHGAELLRTLMNEHFAKPEKK